MATDIAIGTRIRKRRQVLRLTQEQLAAELGVSKGTVANWERGKHFPLRYLGALEAVLGISLEDDVAPRRIISGQLRRQITEVLDDEQDRAYVIALLEGTITRPGS